MQRDVFGRDVQPKALAMLRHWLEGVDMLEAGGQHTRPESDVSTYIHSTPELLDVRQSHLQLVQLIGTLALNEAAFVDFRLQMVFAIRQENPSDTQSSWQQPAARIALSLDTLDRRHDPARPFALALDIRRPPEMPPLAVA